MVHMANQIALFFASYPKEEAVASITNHLKMFWEPRMRRQIIEYVAAGGAGAERPGARFRKAAEISDAQAWPLIPHV